MKKILVILLVVVSTFSMTSCSSDDDNAGGNSNYPQTVNIKFDIITTRDSEAIVNRTLNNNTETDNVQNLPYSYTYAQQQVNQGTYLKLTFKDDGSYAIGTGGSSWTDYSAELKISVGDNVVKTQTFDITEGVGIVQIDYTFE